MRAISTSLFVALSGLLFGATCLSAESLLAYSHLTDQFWQIWSMDLDDKEPRQLTSSPFDKRHPAWLEAGKKIMFRTNNGQLYILDLVTQKEEQILLKFGQVSDPDWSQATKLLTFARFSPNLVDESEIWTIQLDGSEQRVITNLPGLQYHPDFSPDGSKIAYVSGKGPGQHEIWTMDRDGTNPSRLTENPSGYDLFPDWSPDGKKIAFVSDKKGSLDIWVTDEADKTQKQLTDYSGLDTCPAWSPDGRHILFASNQGGDLQIWMVDYLSGKQDQITYGPGESREPACVSGEPFKGEAGRDH